MTEAVNHETFEVPKPRTCPFSPPAEYQEMRERAPVARIRLPNGKSAWAVTRFEDIRSVLTDPRFSSDRRNPGFPMSRRDQGVTELPPSLIGLDPPEHGPARRAVVGEFTVKRMQALGPRIQHIVDDHLDSLLAGPKPADLVQALSLPVPSLVICELLGVPYADHEFFQRRTAQMVSRISELDSRNHAVRELRSYLSDLVTAKEADPGDDLIGRQIRKQREGGEVDHDTLVGLAFLLLIAGHETTANMISLGTVALLTHPEQLALLTADPSKTPDAVEELLRYFTIAEQATSRVAVADVELGGVLIGAGEGVVTLGTVGNRDAEIFDNPGELDVERATRNHVAFGFGAHQCLGQNLARMELRIVFDTLFRRVPGLRLAKPVEELPFKDDAVVYGLHELPVTW